jgi:chloramphenicol-sensitive protein RarD
VGLFPDLLEISRRHFVTAADMPSHRLVVPSAARADGAIDRVAGSVGRQPLAESARHVRRRRRHDRGELARFRMGGVVFFRERLRPFQWVSVALAAAGVLYLTISLGAPPWIALFLAATFGTYGLVKKIAPLSAVHGLTLETSILFVPAAGYLIWAEASGTGALMHSGAMRDTLMVAGGPVTTIPLLLFAAGVQRIPLSLVGMLQYVNPTMQILIAVFMYREPFTRVQLAGFGLVWAALALFAVEGYMTRRVV